MPREGPLIVATRNRHKLAEIQSILAVPCLGLDDFSGAPSVVEDAANFAGNAAKKASELARWLPRRDALVLADDSGLEVDALNGAPGVHSARFAANNSGSSGNSSDAANNEKVLRLLANVPIEKRGARFRCVLVLVKVNAAGVSETKTFEGACEGQITFVARGEKGFGYDPLFIPRGFDLSFAELGEKIKNNISHRAKALHELRDWLRTSPA